MVRNIFLILIVCLKVSLYSQAQNIKVFSWNIRMDTKNDGADQWTNRKKELANFVQKENPDFFGIQEGLAHQVKYLEKQLKDYDYIGVGRDDGVQAGEFMALFYKKKLWKPIKSGNFWLSDTPNLVSRGWDAACHRITTFGTFSNSNKDTITVYNTHLDHQGVLARTNSVTQLNQLINENNHPKILMGDFNFNQQNQLYTNISAIWSDSRLATKNVKEAQEGTFNGFKTDITPKERIDYVFTDPANWSIIQYKSANVYTKKSRHLSDHNPVMVELSLNKKPTYQYRWKVANNDTLPYRIMYPLNFNPNRKYPVVLFLHGSGERGNDNESQLIHGAQLFQDSIYTYQAIYILPQCKTNSYWATVDVNRAPGNNIFTFRDDASPTKALGQVIDVLNTTIKLPYIDEHRIYVGGLSMGGMGTWELLWRLPNTFAAATPICGGGLESKASIMVHVPIWTFHGSADNVVGLKYSQQMVDALYLNGGKPKFTVYPGVGHVSWTPAFAEKDFLKWIFDQRKD